MTDEEKREVWVKVQDNVIHKVYVCTEHPYGVLVEDWVSGIPLHYNVPYCNILTAKAPDEQVRELQAENAVLCERLGKATLNRSIYYIASIWNDATMTRRQEVRRRTVDYVCDKFVKCNGLTFNWDGIYFTREAAEARLKELQGGKE